MKIFGGLLFFASCALASAEVVRLEINRAYIEQEAKKIADAPFKQRRADLPDFLRDMSYDDYQRIRFIPERSLWRGDSLPFQVQFFHLGGLHRTPVGMQEFTGTHVQAIPFVRTFFDYQNLPFVARLPASLEYAGMRVMHETPKPNAWEEVISFLGASYFRSLGKNQVHGASARGIAINTGSLNAAEEFPDFVMFWLGKPERGATSLTIHALLDGPSVTGAYTFLVTPGDDTLVEVRAKLFFRQAVDQLLLAPLTSMYWFGENSGTRHGDYRSEVHDSDGLLVGPEGEVRLWRPLTNPEKSRSTDFPAAAPVGFGLLQRDRDYRNYQDAIAHYQRRPSVWVEPIGRWPEGRVRLVEIPTKNEYVDNIVAGWSPLKPSAAGDTLEFAYRLRWTGAPLFGGPRGWVNATRETVAVDKPKRSMFVIDFGSPDLEKIPESAAVTGEVALPARVKKVFQQVVRVPETGAWRYTFLLDGIEVEGLHELRARLLLEGKPLTETWVGAWQL